jgi:hypothetical protein
MPEYPSADQIALIARERRIVDKKFLEEFEKNCVLGWGKIMGHHHAARE